MKFNFRNANIGVAVLGVILFGGGYLFRGSEAGLTIVVLVAFFAGVNTTLYLSERDERRRGERDQ